MVVSSRLASTSLHLFAALLAGASAGCDGCGDSGTDDGSGGAGNSSGTVNNGNGGSSSTEAEGSIAVVVGTSTGCVPATCEGLGATCGQASDGCDGVLECGSCEDGFSCVGDPPTCEPGGPCTALTCAEAGAECGRVIDGCGGLTDNCGSCDQPEKCGGDGPPAESNVCSIPASCTGLCLDQVTCADPAVTTTISGVVRAPGHPGIPGDPLFDALVYIPNGQVAAFTTGITCSQCGEEASGDPIVSARTDFQGRFVLENVPVSAAMNLVIQLGRWRRQVPIPATTACVDTPLDAELTRLPRNKSEGDIPLIAISTGAVDGLECVLRKIGVDDAEFTNPDGGGRIHLYRGEGAAGTRINGSTPNEGVLLDTPSTLDDYDLVLFPCQGGSYPGRATAQRRANLVNYADAGGRIFATHYSYDWMHTTDPFNDVATWDAGVASIDDQDGIINTSFPKGLIFAQWLVNVGASTVEGLMPVKVVRQNMDAVVDPLGTQWMSGFGDCDPDGNNCNEGAEIPLHMTFNTPVGAAPEDQCGRALFSDFHISDDSDLGSTTFPAGCNDAPTVAMTPQEKLVEFMLFDLGACLTPDVPMCEPISCEDQGLECGLALDGCENELDCGDCPPGETCGGGGEPGICGNEQCVPKSCEELAKNCGMVGNGCGMLQDCGDCTGTQTCGGGNIDNVCGGGIPG